MTRARKPKRPTDADLRRWLLRARAIWLGAPTVWLTLTPEEEFALDVLRTLDPQGWRRAK